MIGYEFLLSRIPIRSATELLMLRPEQIDQIEAIVAECFAPAVAAAAVSDTP